MDFFAQAKRLFFALILCLVFTHNSYSQNSNENADEDAVVINADDAVENQELTDETQFLFNDASDSNVEVRALGFWGTLRVFFVLILLLAIGVGFVWFLRRIQTKQNSSNIAAIDVVASRSLSQQGNLHILKIAGEYLLIGDSGQSISLLKEYKDKEAIDDIELALSKSEAQESHETFIQKFQKKFIENKNIATSVQHTSLISLFTDRKKGGRFE